MVKALAINNFLKQNLTSRGQIREMLMADEHYLGKIAIFLTEGVFFMVVLADEKMFSIQQSCSYSSV